MDFISLNFAKKGIAMARPKINFVVLIFLILFSLTSRDLRAFDDYSGWWFVPGKSGTGLSIEIQGDTLFAALYTYDPFGYPIWMSSPSSRTDGNSFRGDLQEWSGWPFGGTYTPPTSYKVGSFSVDFLDKDSATLRYSTVNPFDPLGNDITVAVPIRKFMPTLVSGDLDYRDINGWWYDPSYNGMGWFAEARGNIMFLAWYHYDQTGDLPDWHSCYGSFQQGATSFVCNLQHWSGGSGLGMEPYQAPVYADVGTAFLVFLGNGKAEFSYNGHTYHLERFKFGQGSSCRSTSDISGIWAVPLPLKFWGTPSVQYLPMRFSADATSGTVSDLAWGFTGTYQRSGDSIVINVSLVNYTDTGVNTIECVLEGEIKDATTIQGQNARCVSNSSTGETAYLTMWEAKRSRFCEPVYDVRGSWQLSTNEDESMVTGTMFFSGDMTHGTVLSDTQDTALRYLVDGDFVFFYDPVWENAELIGFGTIDSSNHMSGTFGSIGDLELHWEMTRQ